VTWPSRVMDLTQDTQTFGTVREVHVAHEDVDAGGQLHGVTDVRGDTDELEVVRILDRARERREDHRMVVDQADPDRSRRGVRVQDLPPPVPSQGNAAILP
jgi:hypothetical protein